METEIAAGIPAVFFPEVPPGIDYSAVVEMYDALFYSATISPDYGTSESAVPPVDP
jgi:hypothetical protein